LSGSGFMGCVQQKPYTLGKVFQGIPPPPADMAQVVFYAPPVDGNDLVDVPYMLSITEDDEVVTGLTRLSYSVHHVTPGPHTYLTGGRFLEINNLIGISEVVLTPQAAQTYYVRFEQTVFPIVGTWSVFKVVPEAVELEEPGNPAAAPLS
jgi:hypothetical protein